MTIPVRPVRRVDRDRRFDLRTTALFFLLVAILLCVLAFVVRTAARIVEHRPFWAAALAMLAVATAVLFRPRWRRFSAARYARRAARALEEAAEKASDSLNATAADEADPPARHIDAPDVAFTPAAPAGPGCGEYGPRPEAAQATTVPLRPGDVEPTVALRDLADYADLDPDGFEQAIADLCVRDDCREVEVVGGAGDLGADVTALAPDGRRVVIQCKQYGDGNKVGSQDMQRFGGTCFTIHEADIAALVTTSDFTAPALEYARQCGIVCVNGEELKAWRRGTGPGPWDRTAVDP